MADKNTESLPASTALIGSEVLHLVQGGNSRRASSDVLKAYMAQAAADVNDFLLPTDTKYDGAISRCLAANNTAYFPPKPKLADANNYYRTVGTVTLQQGQSLIGAGAGISKLVCETANVPTVTLGQNIYWYSIQDMTIAHATTATAGGDGIYQGQGLTDWVDNCFVSNVLLVANYNGANLGKAFAGHWRDVLALGNVNDGIVNTTTGVSTVGGVAQGGPLQIVFSGCAAQVNGHDGFSYKSTGSVPAGSSMGTLIDPVTYANGHHGISAAVGSASHPMHSIRIDGGFIGEDGGHGIYLDTYGANHAICPQFMETAGGYNIYITANNTRTLVKLGHCTGAFYDGIIAVGATQTIIQGGSFTNNGRAAPGSSGLKYAGIRLDGGTGVIQNVVTDDTGSGLQDYGLSLPADGAFVTGCFLDGNSEGPIAWIGGAPNTSTVTACFPASANTGGGTSSTITGDLNVTGNVIANGRVQGKQLSAGAPPTGYDTAANAIYAPAMVAVNAFTLSSASGQFDASAGGSLVARDATINRSLGVGTGATGVAGRIDSSTLVTSGRVTSFGGVSVGGTITGATSISMGGALGGVTTLSMSSSLSGPTSLSMSGAISGVTNLGMTGDLTNTVGNIYLNGTVSGQGGFIANNGHFKTSLGVGINGASGVQGRIDSSESVRVNGTALN